MSLKPVLEMLNTIQAESSTNEKVELLKVYLNDKLFNLVVRTALQPTLKYKTKVLPKPAKDIAFDYTLKDLFQFLQMMAQQSGVSKDDKQALANMAASFDEETYDVVCRIVKKDLRCNATASLINRAADTRLIKVLPYMRYRSDKHLTKMTFPLLAQVKCDGTFVNFFVKENGKMQFITRNASTVFQLDHLREELKHLSKCRSKVFHAELLVWNEDYTAFLDRKTGNGIISKCIKKTCPPELAARITVRVWDVVPEYDFWNGLCETKYRDRLSELQDLNNIAGNDRYFSIVRSKYVYNMEGADKFYKEMRRLGEEGAVLKDDHGPWHNNKSGSKYGCKMKSIKDAELKLVGWEYGDPTKKYRDVVGRIICETADGLLTVRIGSGFSDSERGVSKYKTVKGEKIAIPSLAQLKSWDKHANMQAIVEVQYESVIQDKDTKEYSLFLPRLVEFRRDKDEADTLEHLLSKE